MLRKITTKVKYCNLTSNLSRVGMRVNGAMFSNQFIVSCSHQLSLVVSKNLLTKDLF